MPPECLPLRRAASVLIYFTKINFLERELAGVSGRHDSAPRVSKGEVFGYSWSSAGARSRRRRPARTRRRGGHARRLAQQPRTTRRGSAAAGGVGGSRLRALDGRATSTAHDACRRSRRTAQLALATTRRTPPEIGRASCRERV